MHAIFFQLSIPLYSLSSLNICSYYGEQMGTCGVQEVFDAIALFVLQIYINIEPNYLRLDLQLLATSPCKKMPSWEINKFEYLET